MIKKLILGVFLVLGVSACKNTKISTDYETSYDFSALKTFYLLPVDEKIYENPKVSELDVKRIGELVPQQLSKRYERLNQKENVDFHVRYFLVVEEKMRVDTFNATFGYSRYWHGYRHSIHGPDVKNTYYQQGSIIIDILDAKTQDVIWRGITEGRVFKDDSPTERRQRMSKLLAQLFSHFPPDATTEQ